MVVAVVVGVVLALVTGRPVTEFYRFSLPVVLVMLVGGRVGRWVIRRRQRP